MSNPFLTDELNKIKNLIPKLQPYWQREIRGLPDDLSKELKTIKVIPHLTTSGLETVNSSLEYLYFAQINLEEMIKKEKEGTTISSTPELAKAKTPNPVPLPKTNPAAAIPTKPIVAKKRIVLPNIPTNLPIIKKETALPVKQNIAVQNIQVNKPSLPAPSTKPTIPPTVNKPPASIDFGQYYNKNKT